MTLVDRLWYGQRRPLWPLWPLAWLYRRIATRRRRQGMALAAGRQLPAPVIVVGNITAGGTGKSPLTAWLVDFLRDQGWRPVILTRGYGGTSSRYPLLVTPTTDPAEGGDEPVMLAQQTGVPVVVDPDRYQGGRWALEQDLGDVLVCDDGLQHYRLPRDLELAVVDARRGFGNGAPIPVGPLREPPERLDSVDFVIANGEALPAIAHPRQVVMNLQPAVLRHLYTGKTCPLTDLAGRKVRAVAGIGNPVRFFETLEHLDARVRGRALPDHHRFSAADLETGPDEWLVMTAKDAVKCRALGEGRGGETAHWVLEVSASLPEDFGATLLDRLGKVPSASK